MLLTVDVQIAYINEEHPFHSVLPAKHNLRTIILPSAHETEFHRLFQYSLIRITRASIAWKETIPFSSESDSLLLTCGCYFELAICSLV